MKNLVGPVIAFSILAGSAVPVSASEVDMSQANAGAEHVARERDQEKMKDYQRDAGTRPDHEVGGTGVGGSVSKDHRTGETRAEVHVSRPF